MNFTNKSRKLKFEKKTRTISRLYFFLRQTRFSSTVYLLISYAQMITVTKANDFELLRQGYSTQHFLLALKYQYQVCNPILYYRVQNRQTTSINVDTFQGRLATASCNNLYCIGERENEMYACAKNVDILKTYGSRVSHKPVFVKIYFI